MANDFKIVITATDKATATVRKINDSISKMTRPFSNMQRSASALNKEIGRNPIAKGLKKIGSAANGVAKSLEKVALPMAGIVGVGAVAGLTELASRWGGLGVEIKNTSSMIGISTSGLMGMRGAAQLAGLSADGLSGGLESVRQNLHDAKWGKNKPVIALMNKLGMSFKYTADGAVDAVEGIKDVADAIANQKDLGAKHTIAQAFGVEALLPMLMKGRKGIEEYVKRANELGAVPSDAGIERAEKYGRAWKELGLTMEGVGSRFIQELFPTEGIEKLTKVLSPKKEAPTSGVSKFLGMRFGKKSALDADDVANGRATPKGGQSSSGIITSLGIDTSSLGIRSNNPLNLQPWGKESVFSSPAEGITAGIQNILKNYQGLTLAQFVHKYSPGNGAGNTPASEAAYLSDLSDQTGIGANQVPDLNNQKVLAPLISAMIKHENGQNPYSADMINNTVQHSLEITLNGLPQGVTATAKSKGGTNVPVRINHAMPSLAAG